jgi:hypothetical protein
VKITDNPNLDSFVPLRIVHRSGQRRVVNGLPAHDSGLLEGIGRALHWQHLIETGKVSHCVEIGRLEGLHPTTVTRLLKLALLSPRIIEAFLAGNQPRGLTLQWLLRNRLPVEWQAQQDILASFE